MNWHLTLENFIIFLGFVSILSFVFLPEFVINIILSHSICTVWDTTDMAGRVPTIFNCSALFLLFSVHSCQRTIVPQEQHPALKLGVFLLFLSCSLLFVFPVKKKRFLPGTTPNSNFTSVLTPSFRCLQKSAGKELLISTLALYTLKLLIP